MMLPLHSSSRRIASCGRSAVASRLPLDLRRKSQNRDHPIVLISSRPRSVAISAALTASYSPGSKQCLAQAQEAAWQSGCPDIEPRHVLLGLIAADQIAQMFEIPRKFIWPSQADVSKRHRDESSSVARVTLAALLEQFGMPLDDIRRTLDTSFSDSDDNSQDSSSSMDMDEAHEIVSEEVLALLRLAKKSAITQGSDVVEPRHLLWALLRLPSSSSATSPFSRLFQQLAVRAPGAVVAVLHQVASLPVPPPVPRLPVALSVPGSLSWQPLLCLPVPLPLPLLNQAGGHQGDRSSLSPAAALAVAAAAPWWQQQRQQQQQQLHDQQLTSCAETRQFLSPTADAVSHMSAQSLTQVLEGLEPQHLLPGSDIIDSIKARIQSLFEFSVSCDRGEMRRAVDMYMPLLKAAMKLGIRVPALGRYNGTYGYHNGYMSWAKTMGMLNAEQTAGFATKSLEALEILAWHDFCNDSVRDGQALFKDRDKLKVFRELAAQLPPDVDTLKRLVNIVYEWDLPLSNLSVVPGTLEEVQSWLCADDSMLDTHDVRSKQMWTAEKAVLFCLVYGSSDGPLKAKATKTPATTSSEQSQQGEASSCPVGGVSRSAASLAQVIHSSMKSPEFEPRHAQAAITTLMQLGYDPGAEWMSDFLTYFKLAAPCMSVDQLVLCLEAVASFPRSRHLLQPATATVILCNTAAASSSMSAEQQLTVLQAMLRLGLLEKLQGMKSWSTHCDKASVFFNSGCDRLAAAALQLMREESRLKSRLANDLGISSGSSRVAKKVHRSTNRNGLTQQSSTAAFCQALMQQYCSDTDADASTATTATPQTLASTMLTWVLASSRNADSHYEAEAAAATRMPSDADSAALFSASLSIPSTEISARHALMLAWGAAVMGLEPPEGWLAKMWKRVQPELLDPGSGGSPEPAGSRQQTQPAVGTLAEMARMWDRVKLRLGAPWSGGTQPAPEGWLAKMWDRVKPELGAPGSGGTHFQPAGIRQQTQPAVGTLADSDKLLVMWAFSGLQQAGSQRGLLRAAILVSPDTASPLALSAALWTLLQSGSSSQVPAGWLDQAAEALIRALSSACEGLAAGSSSSSNSGSRGSSSGGSSSSSSCSSSGSSSGGSGGSSIISSSSSSNGLVHNQEAAASDKAGGPQVSQQSILKAAIAGLLCLGQTGYRVGADRVQELQEAVLPRIGRWTAKHAHSTDTAVAEVKAALAAVGITV